MTAPVSTIASEMNACPTGVRTTAAPYRAATRSMAPLVETFVTTVPVFRLQLNLGGERERRLLRQNLARLGHDPEAFAVGVVREADVGATREDDARAVAPSSADAARARVGKAPSGRR